MRLPARDEMVEVLIDGEWVVAIFHETAPIGSADGEICHAPHFELDDDSGRLFPDPEIGGPLPEWRAIPPIKT